MRKIFILIKDRLVSSYWFFPSALFLVAVCMAFLTIRLDMAFGDDANLLKSYLFFNHLSLDTVRVYLSTLVGAVITVVGVVFSLTILTVSSASNQFGPRVLNNFMRDKGNQLTLGVYTSTFVYCSTILLSLYEEEGSLFIPYFSVFVSYLLALLCIGFLIFYIHHIPASLRAESIIHRVALEALDMIDKRFPRSEKVENLEVDKGSLRPKAMEEFDQAIHFSVPTKKVGYVQAIDLEDLLNIATDSNAVFSLTSRPGDFLNGRQSLVFSDKKLDDETRERVESAFAVGDSRTLPQNLMYLLSQLFEICIRAMSPGINDPISAMSCVDWLEACLMEMLKRDSGRAFILDENKNPRIVISPVDVEEVLYQMRKGLAEHMSTNYATSLHLMESLGRLHKEAISKPQQDAIKACGLELLAFCGKSACVKGQMDQLRDIFSSFSSSNLT